DQANTVRTSTQQAQEKFGQQAQENRLDSEANKEQRDNVVGRFNESNYSPDEANFKVSSGLQNQYNAAKTKYEQDKLNQQCRRTFKDLGIEWYD
ncbi:MAG: hypothetical protein AABY22_13285, partial [Nanoarchaeota archaeon]